MFVEESWLWIEISHSLCTQIEQNFFFFFVFFLLDAELDLCLKLHPAISYLLSSVRVYSTCFFFFFQFGRAGIWGTHSKFLLGFPKGPWVFVQTPGWMDWKGHTKFILHTNRAKIIISGLVAESELCLKLHEGPLFLAKTVLDFFSFPAIPKGISKTRLKCFFGLPKGPWIVQLSGSSGLFYLDGSLVFTPGVVCA